MREKKMTKGFGWGFLIVGILFVFAALLAFANPTANLEALAYVFAVLAVVNGVWMILSYAGSVLRVIGGVLNLLLGVFFFVNTFLLVAALPYVFAVWFIANSLFNLLNAGSARVFGNGFYWFSVILGIIGIVLGILLLFQPAVAALTLAFMVGFYLMMIGVECIVYAFARMSLPSDEAFTAALHNHEP